MPESLQQCQIRMPPSALAEFEAWAKELNEAVGYDKHSRSDVMRDILLRALAERRTEKKGRKK